MKALVLAVAMSAMALMIGCSHSQPAPQQPPVVVQPSPSPVPPAPAVGVWCFQHTGDFGPCLTKETLPAVCHVGDGSSAQETPTSGCDVVKCQASCN